MKQSDAEIHRPRRNISSLTPAPLDAPATVGKSATARSPPVRATLPKKTAGGPHVG